MDNNETQDSYLKSLNKASFKITKPIRKPFSIPDPNPLQQLTHPQQQQQQPPVYNINKNDFRDVVQRLTGSSAHDRSNQPPPPPQQPPQARPSSSRLQRIRPPPLIQIPPQQNDNVSPFLPPLPSVHHAAESPISAYLRVLLQDGPTDGSDVAVTNVEKESPISTYMRFLQNSVYARDLPPPQGQQQQQMSNNQMEQQGNTNSENLNSNLVLPNMPSSPLPFGGCVPQYGGLGSPGCLLFSPTSGMPQQLPLSPNVPLPSPRWKGI